jgi:hypothetical protein
MMMNPNELEFLAAWAKEEKNVDPYVLPAHRLQAAHKNRGVTFIRAIKCMGARRRSQGQGHFSSF